MDDTDGRTGQLNKAIKSVGDGPEWIGLSILLSALIVSCNGVTVKHKIEGTHKVEATTNDFGTLEWRVVEVKKEGMEE